MWASLPVAAFFLLGIPVADAAKTAVTGGGGEIGAAKTAVTGASAETGADNALATKTATSASTVADVPQKNCAHPH